MKEGRLERKKEGGRKETALHTKSFVVIKASLVEGVSTG